MAGPPPCPVCGTQPSPEAPPSRPQDEGPEWRLPVQEDPTRCQTGPLCGSPDPSAQDPLLGLTTLPLSSPPQEQPESRKPQLSTLGLPPNPNCSRSMQALPELGAISARPAPVPLPSGARPSPGQAKEMPVTLSGTTRCSAARATGRGGLCMAMDALPQGRSQQCRGWVTGTMGQE